MRIDWVTHSKSQNIQMKLGKIYEMKYIQDPEAELFMIWSPYKIRFELIVLASIALNMTECLSHGITTSNLEP